MKRYIFAMSLEKDKAKHMIASFSITIMEHIIKLLIYSDIRKDDVDGWLNTIARCLHNADDITVKPHNKKLKSKDILSSLFGYMGDDLSDYRRTLYAFKEDNRNGKFNFENKGPYPDFDVTPELYENLMYICYELIDKSMPLLTDKREHSQEEYKDIVTSLFTTLN